MSFYLFIEIQKYRVWRGPNTHLHTKTYSVSLLFVLSFLTHTHTHTHTQSHLQCLVVSLLTHTHIFRRLALTLSFLHTHWHTHLFTHLSTHSYTRSTLKWNITPSSLHRETLLLVPSFCFRIILGQLCHNNNKTASKEIFKASIQKLCLCKQNNRG